MPVIRTRPKPRAKRNAKAPTAVGKPPLAGGDPDAGVGLALPHEHDESIGEVNPRPDPTIAQAHRDLEAGQVDTDLRSTPGLDAAGRQAILRRGPR